jgi:RNA polymerase subunit RPABC4/transcription elongation factor Spt4
MRRRKVVLKHGICMKCNHKCDHEDKQCPKCGAETFSLNTKFERQKYAKLFPREPEKSHSPPGKRVGVKMPGEYKIPGARILRGGQIESKRSKHQAYWRFNARTLQHPLERHGITVAQDLLKVGTLRAKKIEKLHQDLFNHIYDEQNKRIWGQSSPAADTI